MNCGICGFRIPDNVVHPEHPLFGTIDHILPRSKGGTDATGNLTPAHYYCNQAKGCMTEIPAALIPKIQADIAPILLRFGVHIGKKKTKAARQRIKVPVTPVARLVRGKKYKIGRSWLERWEDDGGPEAK